MLHTRRLSAIALLISLGLTNGAAAQNTNTAYTKGPWNWLKESVGTFVGEPLDPHVRRLPPAYPGRARRAQTSHARRSSVHEEMMPPRALIERDIDFGTPQAFMESGSNRITWCAVEVSANNGRTIGVRECHGNFAAWSKSPEGKAYLRQMHGGALPDKPTAFRILCIVPGDNATQADGEQSALIQTFLVAPEIQQLVWTTTDVALQSELNRGSVNAPIWHRGKDLVLHREQWHVLPSGRRAKYVEELMHDLPIYPFLP